MSSVTDVSGLGGNQKFSKYDLTKVFIGNNRYSSDNAVNNSSYNDLTLPVGQVMGRTTAGALVPWDATANNGAQYPVGILAQEVILDAAETKDSVTICHDGDVNENAITVNWHTYQGQSLDTIVASRSCRDWLKAQGINIVPSKEMTSYDNV